jgi:exopolysaccharide production protein ExoZ
MSDSPSKLDWVQAFRGIAVLLVVLTHARYFFLDTPTWPLAEQLMLPGAMGVDLFFVISGFIMVYTTRDNDGSRAYVVNFLIKRFARIWPVYVVATVMWLVVVHNGLGYFQHRQLLVNLTKSLLFYPVDVNAPLYFGQALPLGWTLNFEIYFYLIFGASMLFARLRWFVLASWIFLTTILIPVADGTFAFEALAPKNYKFGYMHIVTHPIVLEFLMGVLIGKLYLQSWFRVSSPVVALHIMWLSIAIVIWYAFNGAPHFHGPFQWGALMACLVLSFALVTKTLPLSPPRYLVYIGTISFSLYLTHTTVQLIVTRMIDLAGISSKSWAHIVLTTAVSILFAAVCHYLLELKLAPLFKRFLTYVLVHVFRFKELGGKLPFQGKIA